MTDGSLDKWDEISKERKTAKIRKVSVSLLNFGLMTCWGFTILFSGFLYAYDGWSSVLSPNFDPSWTAFSYGMIGNLILFSCLVTIIFVILRLYLRKSNMNALVSMKDV
jgi:divalent metal cation (Fe/Co/Zn/Cd) transporter